MFSMVIRVCSATESPITLPSRSGPCPDTNSNSPFAITPGEYAPLGGVPPTCCLTIRQSPLSLACRIVTADFLGVTLADDVVCDAHPAGCGVVPSGEPPTRIEGSFDVQA